MNTDSSYRLHSELMELKQDIVSRESVGLNTNKGCFSINTNKKLSHCACCPQRSGVFFAHVNFPAAFKHSD